MRPKDSTFWFPLPPGKGAQHLSETNTERFGNVTIYIQKTFWGVKLQLRIKENPISYEKYRCSKCCPTKANRGAPHSFMAPNVIYLQL